MASCRSYKGTVPQLIMAFDVGTVFSAVSYSILKPGFIPEIRHVTWLGESEETNVEQSRVPSVIYYNRHGIVRAVGAETLRGGTIKRAEENGWLKAEQFKLHMWPKHLLRLPDVMPGLIPIPSGKSLVEIYADFYRHLFASARIHMFKSPDAKHWDDLKDSIEFVLSHPTGWGEEQFSDMRRAMVSADLVPATDKGLSRIHFVTESEANYRFCIENEFPFEEEINALVIDAGCMSVSLCAYTQEKSSTKMGLTAVELLPASVSFQGSAVVTARARAFMQDLLFESTFVDHIPEMVSYFENNMKLKFKSRDKAQLVKFGGEGDNDPELGVHAGVLVLEGSEIANFFQPTLSFIVKTAMMMVNEAKAPITAIFFVGGLSANTWVFRQMKQTFELLGFWFHRPECCSLKRLTQGAISHYLSNLTVARVARYTYGVREQKPYIRADPQHRKRKDFVVEAADGVPILGGHFSVILNQGVSVSETKEFRYKHVRKVTKRGSLKSLFIQIYRYSGNGKPGWIDLGSGLGRFSAVCSLTASRFSLANEIGMRKCSNPQGKTYYKSEVDVVITFGPTEFFAQLAWIEDGKERRGPAVAIVEEDFSESK